MHARTHVKKSNSLFGFDLSLTKIQYSTENQKTQEHQEHIYKVKVIDLNLT